jgi:MoaA/NifB/PqqE/SkfB family radical SAM enzyme
MISNWSTLDNDDIRKKILNSWLDEIIISVHWLWLLHDIMIWVKGWFDKLIKGLVKFIDENNKKVKISLSFVMTKQNYKFLSKYIIFFDKLWVDQIVVNSLRPEWYAGWANFKKYFFSYMDFISYMNSLWESEKKHVNELIRKRKLIITDMLPCIMKQSGLLIKWVWNVELRITKSWKEGENWNELFDNNNSRKKYIDKCYNCAQKDNCEWIYINYLEAFWEDWILAV